MTIKAISFDLDDTLWPILPVILKAEKDTNRWLIKNYPCIEPLLKKEEIIPIRDELIYKNASLSHQLSKLRSMIVSELAMKAGYDASESKEIASKSFEIFFEARNEVVLFEGVKESLENLKSKEGEENLITGRTTGVIETVAGEMRLNNEKVKGVKKGDNFSMKLNHIIRPSDKLYKVVNSE